MNRVSRSLIAAAGFAVLLLSTAPAEAQRGRGHTIDGVRFDVHLDFGWHQAFGVGFRVDIPIVPDGLVDGVQDELALSPGAEFFFWNWRSRRNRDEYLYYGDMGIWPLLALQWNFYLNDKWSIFPELGIAFFWYWDDFDGGRNTHFGAHPFLGFGARYHFSSRNALLMRINWPAGLQIGITF